jgi:hypothetical protein
MLTNLQMDFPETTVMIIGLPHDRQGQSISLKVGGKKYELYY